jgi:hypothetical protein
MKTSARVAAVLLTAIGAVFLGFGQEPAPNTVGRTNDEKLPQLLRPSDYAFDRAKEMGGDVFKLLPFSFRDPTGANHYYYPSQSYYSFKGRSHEPDQIGFVHGDLRTSFGFFADLGERDLRNVDSSSAEAKYFLSYKPPKIAPDIRSEIERLKDTTVAGVKLTSRVSPQLGHTYLLRSIDYYLADTAVAVHVLEISPDSSITIVWKTLAEFERPRRLFMTDAELQIKVNAVLADLAIQGLSFTVKENYINFTGSETKFERVKAALNERSIQHCGLAHETFSTYRQC